MILLIIIKAQTYSHNNKEWWNGTKLDGFDWNGTDGPVQKSLEKVTVMDQRTKSKH